MGGGGDDETSHSENSLFEYHYIVWAIVILYHYIIYLYGNIP